MKRLKLTKVIASSLLVASVLALNPIGASAEWKQDSTGWWYADSDSYYTGWKQIDGNWYYFDSDGYMAHDTTIDGYELDSDGAWVVPTNTSNNITSKVSGTTNSNFVSKKMLGKWGTLKDSSDYMNIEDNKIDMYTSAGTREYTYTIIEDNEKYTIIKINKIKINTGINNLGKFYDTWTIKIENSKNNTDLYMWRCDSLTDAQKYTSNEYPWSWDAYTR